jgi:hypothetical protein
VLRGLIGTGLASLGLVGGAAAIHYNDSGGATVKVKDHGVTRTVKLGGPGGQTYSCPNSAFEKMKPIDIQSGRIKLTVQDVEGEMKQIQAQNPGNVVPPGVVRRYNDLLRRDDQLITAFNNTVAQHNQILQSDCTKES